MDIVLEEDEKRSMVLHLEATEGAGPEPDGAGAADEPMDLWPVVHAGFGVAAVGVVIGSITGGISLDKAAEAKEYCNGEACRPEAEEPLDSSRTLAHVSTTSFIVGGLGAAVGATALVLTLMADDEGEATEGESDDEEGDDDEMDVDLGFGWVGLRGTF